MAKDKDRSVNPAQAQRKLEKQKAVKKGKAEAQARRNEKLGRRNPERLQRQIDELKAVEESGGALKPREKKVLEELERDVVAIRRARDALGDRAPKFGGERRPPGGAGRERQSSEVLGKRRREDRREWIDQDDGSETDDSVRNIPMPKDTPPPIPPRRHENRPSNPNAQPLGGSRDFGNREPHPLPARPEPVEAKAVYESAPVVRNLRQEAVSRFVPTAVKRKLDSTKGQGKLLEPEELDSLEREGYQHQRSGDAHNTSSLVTAQGSTEGGEMGRDPVKVDQADPSARLAEEEERFRKELRTVQIEEVEDEDA